MKEFIDAQGYVYSKVLGEYQVVETSLSNIYHRKLQPRFLFTENNPDFGQEQLLREIPFLRDIEEYLKNPVFNSLQSLYQLTGKFSSIQEQAERISLISSLKEEIEEFENSFVESIGNPSPIRKFMELQKFSMAKEFVFSRFLSVNPDAFGKVETLVQNKLYLGKSAVEVLVSNLASEDREKYKDLIIDDYHELYSDLPRETFRVLADISLLQLEGKEEEALELIRLNKIGSGDFNPHDVVNNAIVLNQKRILEELWITARDSGERNRYNSKIAELNVLQIFLRGNTEMCKLCLNKEMWSAYEDSTKLSILEIIENRFSFESKRELLREFAKLDFFRAVVLAGEKQGAIIAVDKLLENSIAYFKQVTGRYLYEDAIVGKIYLTPMDGTITSEELGNRADRRNVFAGELEGENLEKVLHFKRSLISNWTENNYTSVTGASKVQEIANYLLSEVRTIASNVLLDVVASKRVYSEFVGSSLYLTPLMKLISPYAIDNLSTGVVRGYASSLTLEEKSLFKESMRTAYLNGLVGHAELLGKMIFSANDFDQLGQREKDQYKFAGRDLSTGSTVLTFLRYSSALALPKFTAHFIEQLHALKIEDASKTKVYIEFGDIILNTLARGDGETCKVFISQRLFNDLYDNVFRAQIVNTILTRSGRETRNDLMGYLAKNLLLVSDEVRQQVFKMADNRGEFAEVSEILDTYVERSKTYCDRLGNMLAWKDKIPSENFPSEEGLNSRQEKFLYLAFLHENKELYKTEGEFNRFLRARLDKIREIRCSAEEMEDYFGFSVDTKIVSLIKAVDKLEEILSVEHARDAKKKKRGGVSSSRDKSKGKYAEERIASVDGLMEINLSERKDRVEEESITDIIVPDAPARGKNKKAVKVENSKLREQQSEFLVPRVENPKENKERGGSEAMASEDLSLAIESSVEGGWTTVGSKQKTNALKVQAAEKKQDSRREEPKVLEKRDHKEFITQGVGLGKQKDRRNSGPSVVKSSSKSGVWVENRTETQERPAAGLSTSKIKPGNKDSAVKQGKETSQSALENEGNLRGEESRNSIGTLAVAEGVIQSVSDSSSRREDQNLVAASVTPSSSVVEESAAIESRLSGVKSPRSSDLENLEAKFGSSGMVDSQVTEPAAMAKGKDRIGFVAKEEERRSASSAQAAELQTQVSYMLNNTTYYSPLNFFMRAEYSGASSVDVYKDIYGKFFIKTEADGVSSWNAFSLAEGKTISVGPGVPTDIKEMKFTQQVSIAKAAVTKSII